MKKQFGRIAALVLTIVMIAGVLPVSAGELYTEEETCIATETATVENTLLEDMSIYSVAEEPTAEDPLALDTEDPAFPVEDNLTIPATEDPTTPLENDPIFSQPEESTPVAGDPIESMNEESITSEAEEPSYQEMEGLTDPVAEDFASPEEDLSGSAVEEPEPLADEELMNPIREDSADLIGEDPMDPTAEDPTEPVTEETTLPVIEERTELIVEPTIVEPTIVEPTIEEPTFEELSSEEPTAEEEILIEEEVEPLLGTISNLDGMEVTLYGLNSEQEPYISIPDSYAQSWQIPVPAGVSVSYHVESGTAVTVSQTGLISVYNFPSIYIINGVEYTKTSIREEDTVIRVNSAGETAYITVHTVNYAKTYAESVMADYISANITDSMTNYEKIEKIAQFVAYNYDYSTNASGYIGMILTGGGDCWASTSTIIRMCQMIGLDAWGRNANQDSGAGSNHQNAIVYADGIYYIVEAGFTGIKPRPYEIYQKNHCYNYYHSGNGIIITQYDGRSGTGSLIVPATIDGYTVIGIGDESFYMLSCSEVILPETIQTIGDYSFANCSNLTRINIPAGVVSIGPGFLNYCENLTEINVASGNTSFVFQDGILYSGDMTRIITAPTAASPVIPNTVTTIEAYSFRGNNNIRTLELPASVTTIGEGAFGACSKLSGVYAAASSLVTIGAFAFHQDNSLADLALPITLQTIGDAAFRDCDNITNIWFAGTEVQWEQITIGVQNDPFISCNNIIYGGTGPQDSWNFANGILTISGTGTMRTFHSSNETPWADFKDSITEIHVEEGITGISQYAFSGLKNLTKVSLPDTLTSIGYSAFDDCYSLTSITLPDSVTSLGQCAFANCYGLREVRLSASLEIIPFQAFYFCYNLNDIYLPTSVTTVVDNAFLRCYGILNVYYGGTQEDWNAITFMDGNDYLTGAPNIVYQSMGSFDQWQFHNGVLRIYGNGSMREYASIKEIPWMAYSDEIVSVVIEEGITTICRRAFENMYYLKTVSLPSTLTRIGDSAFYNCRNLTSVEIPSLVTYVGTEAFSQCSSMKSVVFAPNVSAQVTIKYCAFLYCDGLEMITLPEHLSEIDFYTFAGCTSLAVVNIPEGVTSIGDSAFSDCISLSAITIPDSVQIIKREVFYGDSQLTIWGNSGSYAQTYAADNHIPFRVKCNAHRLGKTAAKAKTCTADGNIAYWTCSVCGKYFSDANGQNEISLASTVIPAGHEYDAGVITMPMNEIGVGKMVTTCALCGDSYTELVLREDLIGAGSMVNDFFWSVDTDYHLAVLGTGEIPDNYYYFPWYYFASSITAINLSQGITSVGFYAFADFTNLRSVTIPVSVTSIPMSFDGSGLTDVYYQGSERQWRQINIEYGSNDPLETAKIHYAVNEFLTGWQVFGGKYYYYNNKGVMQTGFVKIGTKYYYIDRSTGILQTGWVQDGSRYYYFSKKDGSMQTGFVQVGNKYYYFSKTDGSMQFCFVSENGKYYYFSKTNGSMQFGFVKDGGKYYYFSKTNGTMQIGFVKDNGKYYYFNPSTGAIKTGWVQYAGYWFYFDPVTGAMVTGTREIGGKTYQFNSYGVCIG